MKTTDRPVTARAGKAHALKQARIEFQAQWCEALVASSEDAIISKTLDGIVTSWNRKAEVLFGYTAEEMIGQSLRRLFPPDRLDEEGPVLESIQRGETVRHFETVRLHRDGRRLDVSVTISPIRDGGRIVGASKIVRDVTERVRREAALRDSEQRYRQVVESSPDGFWRAHLDGRLLTTNGAYSRMSGYSAEELARISFHDLEAKDAAGETEAHLRRIPPAGADRFETLHRRKDGSLWPVEITASAMPGGTEFCVFLRDLTALKALEAERQRADEIIRSWAFSDPLTQLPNRRLLQDRLCQAQASAARSGQFGALLFIDLDHFKQLNDSLGHEAGDRLLVEVADRLRASVRAEDTVARIGGDEFVVMLVGLGDNEAASIEHVSLVGAKLRAALSLPCRLDDHLHHCSPSIGATLFRDDSLSTHVLLARADEAMYAVKAAGGNGFRLLHRGEPDASR
jgi:diguanylate cyclase (GGDEF)-like protein/PAS domain S-box-containing protein